MIPTQRLDDLALMAPEEVEEVVEKKQRRNRRWLVPAAITITIAVALFFILLAGHATSQHGQAVPHVTPVPAPSASAPAPAQSGEADLLTAPGDVAWRQYQGVSLPLSPSAGPFDRTAPVVSGYAHTPAGALVAATQLNVRILVTPNGGWRKVLEQQVMPSVGRDSYAQMRASVGDEAPEGGYAQYAGFRYVTYTDDLAVITIATRDSGGTLQMANTTLAWSDGDWRLVLPASGLAQPQVISDLSGYTPWGQA